MLGGSNHAVDGPPQALSQPSADDVRAQLERLLASPDLDVPARLRKFLRYIVEETLAGRADRIKAYSVGTVCSSGMQASMPRATPSCASRPAGSAALKGRKNPNIQEPTGRHSPSLLAARCSCLSSRRG